ncbi:hypothetical protein JQC67_06840 [Aurantibacter crassamenti]|uniref:hypothetical protein n=1 Tax=Aurantibacter crassamenti TaxID=1837375 RepID=UPI0019395904|nr:hypothetical protein [Aurantibacter crassamenti]MBM1105846.1 hypothetical protein [Aurantibacter crassamenti]
MKPLFLNILFAFISIFGYSQIDSNNEFSDEPTNGKIKIYLDCNDCDSSFFRNNLEITDFVRDQKLADIHLFVTEQGAGGSGTEYTINFIGANQFSDLNYKLKVMSPQDDTDILNWERLLKLINIGLLPYLSRTSDISEIEIQHHIEETHELEEELDPWDYWIFRTEIGTEFEGEKTKKEYSFSTALKADRVNDLYKFKSEISYDLDVEIFSDNDEEITSKREEAELKSRLIYSIDPRWSVGIFGELSTSSYLNINTETTFQPAIEYNIFPWDKSDNKVFTFAYHLKASYLNYNEITIYDKYEEWLASEALRISLILRQPWGAIESQLEGSHYFHDFSKNRLSFETDISVRVARGLSFFVELETDLIHDQLYLPAGETSRDDILLQQRKLATNFEMSYELGIRYTFGSNYNNIVNLRL